MHIYKYALVHTTILHQYVSATLVTIIRVYYKNDIIGIKINVSCLYHTFLYNYLCAKCVRFIRHTDGGHEIDRRILDER